LLQKGLVTREEAKNDRRYQDIKLTKKGANLIPKMAALADMNDDEFFSSIPLREREKLKATLRKLAKLNGLTKFPID
jgi:DNA-binding MarR family transcriptional regulator